MFELTMLLALCNLIIGIVLVGVSICRINSMCPDTPLYLATPFALLSAAGFVIAFSPLQGEWPSAAQVFISFCLLVFVLCPKAREETR